MAKPQPQISPRKYIQTRARSLPIHRCLVNADWRESDLASVIVMRRHVNGNVTAGSFLVDLLCLGVKDTFFWFNQPESEIVGPLPQGLMIEIDYNLAHNIIWAGHDFAADLGIEPAKDFALTRMILEADDDEIPLIEVHTGDEQGRPQLVETHPGQYRKELEILRKTLGEGQFDYVPGGAEMQAADSDDTDWAGADFNLRLSTLGPDLIGIRDAGNIVTEDIMDDELVLSRPVTDQLTISVERYLRALPMLGPEYFEDFETAGMTDQWGLVAQGLTVMPGSAAPVLHPGDPDPDGNSWIVEMTADNARGSSLLQNAANLIPRYRDNPMSLMDIADFLVPVAGITDLPELTSALRDLAADYLLARIIMARIAAANPGAYVADELPEAFARTLPELFPGFEGYDSYEYYQYFLLQLQQSLDRGDVKAAIRAYKGLADIDEWTYSLMGLQARLGGMLEGLITTLDAAQQNQE